MNVRAVLRLGLAWLVLPVGAVAGYLFMGLLTPTGTRLALAEQVNALLAAAIVFPVAGTAAAIAGSRLRQSRLLAGSATVRRSSVRVFAQIAVPLTLIAAASLLLPIAVTTAAQTGTMAPHPVVLLTATALAAATTCMGLGMGRRFQPLVAVPAAALWPFLMIGFPPALQPVWLRFLTSLPSFCCQVYDAPDPRAVLGLVLFTLAQVCVGFLLFTPLGAVRVPFAQLVAAVLAIAAVSAAITAVRPLPAQAVVARSGAPRCEPVGRTSLCLWPEHDSARAQVSPLLQQISDISVRTGAQIPTEFTEVIPDDARWPRATIDLGPGSNTTSWVLTALDPATTCRLRRPTNGSDHTEAPNPASHALRAWWADQLGRNPGVALADDAARLLVDARRRGADGVNDLVRASARIACGSEPE